MVEAGSPQRHRSHVEIAGDINADNTRHIPCVRGIYVDQCPVGHGRAHRDHPNRILCFYISEVLACAGYQSGIFDALYRGSKNRSTHVRRG